MALAASCPTGSFTCSVVAFHPFPMSSTAESSRMPKSMTMKEIETEVSKFGNGAHAVVPKDWMGKKVRVTLLE